MFNWFKKNTDNSRHQSVDGKLINSTISFGDTITNIVNIPKKIVLGISLLLVILIAAVLVWRGNFQTVQVNHGTVNQIQGNVINQGVPLEQLIELSKKLGVAEKERDEWIHKYRELEKFVASRTDDIAKKAKAFLDNGDLEQAEKLFIQALANDLKNAATNAFSLAQIKDLQYQWVEAITYYRQAVQLNPDNADGWNSLGNLLYLTGELDEAIAAYQKVLDLGKTHQNQQEIAGAYANLGVVYKTLGELDKAINFHSKALVIDETMGNKQGMAEVYGNLGEVYRMCGELDTAVEMYQKSLVITESLGDKKTIAVVYGNLGSVYQIRGDSDKAINFYNKGLEIQIALGDKEGMAAKYGNLGIVYKKRGELDKAINFYNKALAINRELGRKEGMASDYGNLGIVYKTRGELDKAIDFYHKSLAIDEQMGNKQGMATNYSNLGIVYEQTGNKAEAKRYWQQAINLYKYIGSPEWKDVQGWLDNLK
jgi:protein O-GlcNAc transferase